MNAKLGLDGLTAVTAEALNDTERAPAPSQGVGDRAMWDGVAARRTSARALTGSGRLPAGIATSRQPIIAYHGSKTNVDTCRRDEALVLRNCQCGSQTRSWIWESSLRRSHPALSHISPILGLHPSFHRPQEETDLGVPRHWMPLTDWHAGSGHCNNKTGCFVRLEFEAQIRVQGRRRQRLRP